MSTVETFRGVSLLIFKWLLYAVLFIVLLSLLIIGGWWLFNWYTYERHVAAVEITVTAEKKDCDDDSYPLFVKILNSSNKTIDRTSFRIAARVKGRSSDIANYNSYSDDHILEPKTGWAQCWSAPELRDTVKDLRDLDWSIDHRTISFKN